MPLTPKDILISFLIFAFISSLSPLFFLLDETALEGQLPIATSFFSAVAFTLFMPVHVVTIPFQYIFGLNPDFAIEFTPLIAGAAYAISSTIILAKLNKNKQTA